MSLLTYVTRQTSVDPLENLSNELTAGYGERSNTNIEVALNVVDTGEVPAAYLNTVTTIRALIGSEYLAGDCIPARLIARALPKKDIKLAKLIREAAENIGMMDRFDEAGDRSARPLDSSQRTAVLRHLSGEMISSVTGPPGTGKTSTMRALIGDAIVRPLLSKEDLPAPRMIIATGATNQAVTNIIESFTGASQPRQEGANGPRSISMRWIDGVSSYGWFAPSKTNQSRMATKNSTTVSRSHFDKYLAFGRWCRDPEAKNGLRFSTTFLGAAAGLTPYFSGGNVASNLADAGTAYLEAAANSLGTRPGKITTLLTAPDMLQEVMSKLRGLVMEQAANQFAVQEALWQLLSTADRGAVAGALGLALSKALTSCGPFSLPQEKAYDVATSIVQAAYEVPGLESGMAEGPALDLFHKVQAVLDTGPRIAAFQYASRYWEGRWLTSRMFRFQNPVKWAEFLAQTATEKGMATAIRLDMDEQLCLAPCIVSTAHTLPSIFGVYGRPETAFGVADEMIVDEAGQAPQELIAPVTAFARRAIFLGDTKQIEPVRGMTPERDAALVRSFLAAEKLDESSIPDKCRISAGSMMEMAVDSSSFTPLTLKFHYRCLPSIISWSNTHCYKEELVPVRQEHKPLDEDETIPSLGFIAVRGQVDRSNLGSIGNVREAYDTVDFLINHRAEIEARFMAPLHECVAVLTPYARQTMILRSALRQKFAQNEEVQITKMVVGSVHQLQGSERPLVIFSTAVDSPPGSAFFDKAFNILNVARSRATDSFILVASPGMLSRRDGNPFGFFAADIRDNGRRLYPRPQEFAQPRPNETVARMSAGIG
jgi:hypothetical protein